MRKGTRRAFIGGGLALAAVAGGTWFLRSRRPPPVGVDLPLEYLDHGRALVRASPVVDVHSHAGRSFLVGAEPASFMIRLMRDGFEDRRVAGMQNARVTASLFALVSDVAVLGIADGRIQVTRDFAPGEAWADFGRQLGRLEEMAERGVLVLALTPDDIRAAHEAGSVVILAAAEGGDFIEDRLERLKRTYDAGLRAVTLVHYRPNDLGDNQTSPPRHGGLSAFGREVVREMNRLGMIIDVAHASLATCEDIVAESHAPVMLSHSNLQNPAVDFARFISPEHARLVVASGGIIGAWPAGIGSESLADFAGQILDLVEVVGVEHVSVGTDLDANLQPVLTRYAEFPVLAALLLWRGLAEDAVAAVLGGNFLRLFDDVVKTSWEVTNA